MDWVEKRKRRRSKSGLARPYMERLSSMRRLICPSSYPLIQSRRRLARTEAPSRSRLTGKLLLTRTPQVRASASQASKEVMMPGSAGAPPQHLVAFAVAGVQEVEKRTQDAAPRPAPAMAGEAFGEGVLAHSGAGQPGLAVDLLERLPGRVAATNSVIERFPSPDRGFAGERLSEGTLWCVGSKGSVSRPEAIASGAGGCRLASARSSGES